MHTLVHLTGGLSFDKLEEIMPQLEFLANQPPLEVDKIFIDKNPQLYYREVFASRRINNKVEYHVMDMGHVKDVPEALSIGSRIYSEEEVEELRHFTVKSSYA